MTCDVGDDGTRYSSETIIFQASPSGIGSKASLIVTWGRPTTLGLRSPIGFLGQSKLQPSKNKTETGGAKVSLGRPKVTW